MIDIVQHFFIIFSVGDTFTIYDIIEKMNISRPTAILLLKRLYKKGRIKNMTPPGDMIKCYIVDY